MRYTLANTQIVSPYYQFYAVPSLLHLHDSVHTNSVNISLEAKKYHLIWQRSLGSLGRAVACLTSEVRASAKFL